MSNDSMKSPKRKRSKALEELSTTLNMEGVMVRVSCFRIDSDSGSRLEVQLEGGAQRATVDVPLSQLGHLDAIAQRAANGFAASLRLRMRPDGRLP